MRRGFALLETLIALVLFSILLIGGAKLYLCMTEEKRVYERGVYESLQVQNVFLLVQNTLKHSFFLHISPTLATFYPLDPQAYFSTSFTLTPRLLSDKKLSLPYPTPQTAFLLSIPSNTLYPIIRKTADTLEFLQKLEGKYFLPLQKKFTLEFASSTLYLNSQPLLKNLKSFQIKQKGKWIEIKACMQKCYEYTFALGEVYEKIQRRVLFWIFSSFACRGWCDDRGVL